jgi:hypothetical protein
MDKDKELLVKCLFGTKMDIHEKYIFENRLELVEPTSFLCIVSSDEHKQEFIKVFGKSAFLRSRHYIASSTNDLEDQEKICLTQDKKHFVYALTVEEALVKTTPHTSCIVMLCVINSKILKTIAYRLCFNLAANEHSKFLYVNIMKL